MKRQLQRNTKTPSATVRCAIYGRKSTSEGLDSDFNSIDNQREVGEQFIQNRAADGWVCVPDRYDDGGFSGGNMERPALLRLLADIAAGKIDAVVCYKIDRLSRSLIDFAKMMAVFEEHHASCVAVTQQFDTTTPIGRLTLHMLLSFAQFERELISERTRDKLAATRRKGKYTGGMPLLGYDVVGSKLVINTKEAAQVRQIFQLYLDHESLLPVVQELARRGWKNKLWRTKKDILRGGRAFERSTLHQLLTNPTYIGKVRYKDEVHSGEHEAIISQEVFAKVQAMLSRNRISGGAEVRNKYGAILKGLLRCGPCKCSMIHTTTAKGSRRYRYYTCSNGQKKGRDTCPSGPVPAAEIEQFVVDHIREIGQDPSLVAETIAQARKQVEAEMKRLRGEQASLGRDSRRWHAELAKAAAQGPSPGTTARLADLQERIKGAEVRLTQLVAELDAQERQHLDEDEAAATLAQFDPIWQALTTREQERLLHLLIERVDYDGESGNISLTFHRTGLKALASQANLEKRNIA
jgi:site-specific DNA recombinase